MLPIFFVHIPKTAGTSFRKSAERYFGCDYVVYDYSLKSGETSDLVVRTIYEKADPFLFDHSFSNRSQKFMCGHVHAIKYVHLFGVAQTVTFLRDPIQRVISEYDHFVRNYDYTGDFPSFYRKPHFTNRLSRILYRVPLESMGFVGLTEEYHSSLLLLNEQYATDIEYSAVNIGRKSEEKEYEISEDEIAELQQLNLHDLDLYQRGVHLFGQRRRISESNKPYVHGVIQGIRKGGVQGWAWWSNSLSPVEVDIYLDGDKISTTRAKDLCPALLHLSPPRKGYVGFQCNFPKNIKVGSVVKVSVAKTGQVLGEVRFSGQE